MSNSTGSSGGRPPTFIECSVCGKEYGSRSIGIHEPQCLQKLRRTEIANTTANADSSSKPMRRKKKSSKQQQQQQEQKQRDQYYFDYGSLDHSKHRNTPVSCEDDAGRSSNAVETDNKIILPRIQPNSLINYKAFSDHNSSRNQVRRPRTATLPRPKILNLDFIQYDMSLTRLDFSSTTAATLASSSNASSPSPVDPSNLLIRMDDNQNSILGGGNNGGPNLLPAMTTSGSPFSTKSNGTQSYHPNLFQVSKLTRNSDAAGKLPPRKELVGDPLQKWNLTCTSTADNDTLPPTNRQTEAKSSSTTTATTSNSFFVASTSANIGEHMSFPSLLSGSKIPFQFSSSLLPSTDNNPSLNVNTTLHYIHLTSLQISQQEADTKENTLKMMMMSFPSLVPDFISSFPPAAQDLPLVASIPPHYPPLQFSSTNDDDTSAHLLPASKCDHAHLERLMRNRRPAQQQLIKLPEESAEPVGGPSEQFVTPTNSSESLHPPETKVHDNCPGRSGCSPLQQIETAADNKHQPRSVFTTIEHRKIDVYKFCHRDSATHTHVEQSDQVGTSHVDATSEEITPVPNPLQNLKESGQTTPDFAASGLQQEEKMRHFTKTWKAKARIPARVVSDIEDESSGMTSDAEFHSVINSDVDTDVEEGYLEDEEEESALNPDDLSESIFKNCKAKENFLTSFSPLASPELRPRETSGTEMVPEVTSSNATTSSCSGTSETTVMDTFLHIVKSMIPKCICSDTEDDMGKSVTKKKTKKSKASTADETWISELETDPDSPLVTCKDENGNMKSLLDDGGDQPSYLSPLNNMVIAYPLSVDIQGNTSIPDLHEAFPKVESTRTPRSALSSHRKERAEVRFQEQVTHLLPTESTSITDIYHSHAPVQSSLCQGLDVARSPSDSMLFMLQPVHATSARVSIVGTGSETDDEDESSEDEKELRLFPAHEVKSSRTLIRKRFFKKRKDRLMRLCDLGTEQQLPTTPSHVEVATQCSASRLVSPPQDKSEQTVEVPVPVPKQIPKNVASRPKSATDATASAVHRRTAAVHPTLTVGEGGDNMMSKVTRSAQPKRSPTSMMTTSKMVDQLVSALVRLQKIQLERATGVRRPITNSGQRPHTANADLSGSTSTSGDQVTASHSTPHQQKTQKSRNRNPWTATNRWNPKATQQSQKHSKPKRPWTSPLESTEHSSSTQQTPSRTRPLTLSPKPFPPPSISNNVQYPEGRPRKSRGIRYETINRLATPKGFFDERSTNIEPQCSCVKRNVQKKPRAKTASPKIPSGSTSTSGSGKSTCQSSIQISKTSMSTNNKRVDTQDLPKSTPVEKFVDHEDEIESDNYPCEFISLEPSATQESVKVLIKRSLRTESNYDGPAFEVVNKIGSGGILKQAIPVNTQVSQATQTQRRSSHNKVKRGKGILKNLGVSGTISRTPSKTVSLCLQPTTSSSTQTTGSHTGKRHSSSKSVRILHHPYHHQQAEGSTNIRHASVSEESCDSTGTVLKSPREIFKKEFQVENETRRKLSLSARSIGETSVCFDDQLEVEGGSSITVSLSPQCTEEDLPATMAAVDVDGMMGFTNVTMLVPKNPDLSGRKYVDLNIIVRRRNAEGALPQMKELQGSITPRNIYLIVDDTPENTVGGNVAASDDSIVRTPLTSSTTPTPSPRYFRIPYFLPRSASPLNQHDGRQRFFSIYYGGQIPLSNLSPDDSANENETTSADSERPITPQILMARKDIVNKLKKSMNKLNKMEEDLLSQRKSKKPGSGPPQNKPKQKSGNRISPYAPVASNSERVKVIRRAASVELKDTSSSHTKQLRQGNSFFTLSPNNNNSSRSVLKRSSATQRPTYLEEGGVERKRSIRFSGVPPTP